MDDKNNHSTTPFWLIFIMSIGWWLLSFFIVFSGTVVAYVVINFLFPSLDFEISMTVSWLICSFICLILFIRKGEGIYLDLVFWAFLFTILMAVRPMDRLDASVFRSSLGPLFLVAPFMFILVRQVIEDKRAVGKKGKPDEGQATIDAASKTDVAYSEYLKTEHWAKTRQQALERAGYRCQLCNSDRQPLNVHHRTYERLWHELDSDLIVLCERCHKLFHEAEHKDG